GRCLGFRLVAEHALDRVEHAAEHPAGRLPGLAAPGNLGADLDHGDVVAALLGAGRAQGLVDRLAPQHLGVVEAHVLGRNHADRGLGLAGSAVFRFLGPRRQPDRAGQAQRGKLQRQSHRNRSGGMSRNGQCRDPGLKPAEPQRHGDPAPPRRGRATGPVPARRLECAAPSPRYPVPMSLRLYNSLTRQVEAFAPLDPACPTMYVCGPTVYNYVHIGNARGPVVFGVLAALLRRRHGALKYARNITDVDDKINAAAAEQGVPISVITDRFAAAYREDMAALGVAGDFAPDIEPTATGHIAQMIAMCERLVAEGHAYAAEGHVLFSVASFADYGRLSRRDTEEMLAGARVEVAPYRRDPGDFVLWKPSSDDLPGWDSPWGRGRPGWHIECSAMAEAHLGTTID